jgi:hypothetical protein
MRICASGLQSGTAMSFGMEAGHAMIRIAGRLGDNQIIVCT